MRKAKRSHKLRKRHKAKALISHNLKLESRHKLFHNLKFETSHKFLECHKAKALISRNLKSQMIGQVFIYVLAMVLIAFIFIYGYNAITTFREKAEQVSFVKFKTDLSNMVEIISPDYGSVKIRYFEVPSGYDRVCFVNNFEGYPDLSGGPGTYSSLFDTYPIVKDSVNDKVEKNVFLIKIITEESFFIGDITVDEDNNGIEDDIMCIQVVSNRIKIKFEGKGDHAFLAES